MANEKEIMRVLRVPPMSKLMVEVSGQQVQKLTDLADERTRQRVLAAIGDLIVFAGGYQTLVDAGLAPPMAPVETPGRPATGPLDSEQAKFIATLEAQRDALKSMPPPKPRFAIMGAFQPPQIPQEPPPPSEKKAGMVEEIDVLVQKYLAADPALAGRSVHLEQNPAGGLRIRVDGQLYQEPKEIEDQKVQAVIRQAVKEWRAGAKAGG